NEAGYPHEGKVDFVDNQVNPKTGTLRLRGVFPNKDELLTPGYFVRIRIPISNPYKAILINERAIETDQGRKIVFVVGPENKVEVRVVRLGSQQEGSMRVIEDGLTTKDAVIVEGLQQVRPGMVVEPREEKAKNENKK